VIDDQRDRRLPPVCDAGCVAQQVVVGDLPEAAGLSLVVDEVLDPRAAH